MASENAKTGPITDVSTHNFIQNQVLQILDDSDLSEAQKQEILVAMSCPCCGSGGLSLSIPLDNSKPVF